VSRAGSCRETSRSASGVLSYAGQLNFDIIGDPVAVPDLAVFADGVSATLRQLGAQDSAERIVPGS
jgi:hypothetical protein